MANKPKAKPGRKSKQPISGIKQLSPVEVFDLLTSAIDHLLVRLDKLETKVVDEKPLESAKPDTVIPASDVEQGAASGIAHRTHEDIKNGIFRSLTTIRCGFRPDKITFNFGSYEGPQTKDGGGEPIPPCP